MADTPPWAHPGAGPAADIARAMDALEDAGRRSGAWAPCPASAAGARPCGGVVHVHWTAPGGPVRCSEGCDCGRSATEEES